MSLSSRIQITSDILPRFIEGVLLERLNSLLSHSEDLTTSQIAVAVGISKAESLELLWAIERNRYGTRYLAVYHQCEDDEYLLVEYLPYGAGFPKMPYECPNCGTEINSPDLLCFDFVLVLSEMLFFVQE